LIRALIFDLDGTLVKTEKLKALSYAKAAIELCPNKISQEEVIEAFKEVVGLSRKEVASFLMEKFNLTEKSRQKMVEFGVQTAWQAFVQVRLEIYNRMLTNPEIILENRWHHTLALLEEAKKANCKIGLATMSHYEQAIKVLTILELDKAFDFIATRDDVEFGKPNPEMYHLVANQFALSPSECLAIEDSPTGVLAAQNAGMLVVAVSTPFTQEGLRRLSSLPKSHIGDDADSLLEVVAHVLSHTN